jgi:long-chain fatty acid transport protein
MKCLIKRQLLPRLTVVFVGWMGLASFSHASSLQLWDQDAVSVATNHAGIAAYANDASTTFNNPAGLIRLPHPQVLMGGAEILTNIRYQGLVAINTINSNQAMYAKANGGNSNFLPFAYFAYPISDRVALGFSINVPFASSVDYGFNSALQYVAWKVSASVVNISPAIALKLTEQWSVGAGIDYQKMNAEFDEMASIGAGTNSSSISKANDNRYGFHLGALYQVNNDTRVGFSYHSKVVHHLSGTSKFTGPIADSLNGGPIVSNHAMTTIPIPAFAALGIYHLLNQQFAIMANTTFSQWSAFQNLTLQNIAGVQGYTPSTKLTVSLPQHYRNTWSVSVGSDYFASNQLTLRGGIGFEQSPTKDNYRNIELPDSDRFIMAVGGHYQFNRALGMDLGYTHVFFNRATIHPPVQVAGSERATTNGNVTKSANVIAGQLVWDMA